MTTFDISPFKYYCKIANAVLLASTLCSTLFILSMTFGRFYSIIRPHKAASFNTYRKAKITILSIILFSFSYNFPHFIFTGHDGKRCPPYGRALDYAIGQFYYWFSAVISFFLPFVLLLIMNSVIIHTLRKRSSSNIISSDKVKRVQGQSHNEGESQKNKISETQIYTILLLITFGFLTLTTPYYSFFLYVIVYDFEQSPREFAGYNLFYNFARQTYYTNHAINFYLYVISGQKFRADLLALFRGLVHSKAKEEYSVYSISTRVSAVSE